MTMSNNALSGQLSATVDSSSRTASFQGLLLRGVADTYTVHFQITTKPGMLHYSMHLSIKQAPFATATKQGLCPSFDGSVLKF